MNRETQMEIITYMVDTSGRDRTYFGEDGEVSNTSKYMTVPLAIVCEDDKYTEVELFEDGSIDITGWDGTEGMGDSADTFKDEEIEKIYNALFDMV